MACNQPFCLCSRADLRYHMAPWNQAADFFGKDTAASLQQGRKLEIISIWMKTSRVTTALAECNLPTTVVATMQVHFSNASKNVDAGDDSRLYNISMKLGAHLHHHAKKLACIQQWRDSTVYFVLLQTWGLCNMCSCMPWTNDRGHRMTDQYDLTSWTWLGVPGKKYTIVKPLLLAACNPQHEHEAIEHCNWTTYTITA